MKAPLLLALILATSGVASAAEKADFKPHPVTATFYIDQVHCTACVDAITLSLMKVKSVTGVKMNPADGYALISFDTHVSSYHQIAQAIADTGPLHGEKYVPSLRFTVADYAKGDNSAKIDAVFAKRKEWVKVENKNRERGEFKLTFLPLKLDPQAERPQGWNAGHFGHAIGDPAPKGLGLKFVLKREGAVPPARKK